MANITNIKWNPIIEDPDLLQPIKQKLALFAGILAEHTHAYKNKTGLMDGMAGMALFFYYYARLTEEQEHWDKAFELVESIFERVASTETDLSFSSGLAGVGWTVNLLAQENFMEEEAGMFNQLDAVLSRAMEQEAANGHYDLLFGALGSARYFCSRPDTGENRQYLSSLVKTLEKYSRKDKSSGGIKWRDPVSSGDEHRHVYNLGLAHGIPSIIAFLSRMVRKNIDKERAANLLKGAMAYLTAQAINANYGTQQSIFPASVIDDSPTPPPCDRLAWCYGDPGIASALWLAAGNTGNQQWEQEAIRLFLHIAKQRNPQENKIHDACLCHGSSGIAHIMNRIFQETRKKEFKEASVYWFEKTLKMTTQNASPYSHELLNGITGTALTMIAAVSDINPTWDAALMLS